MNKNKYLIIDLILDYCMANYPRIIFDIPKKDQIRLLNTMVYIAIYQKMANNHRYQPDRIIEYFEFDEYETYLFNVSCSRLKRFGIIDTEYEWIEELLLVNRSFIYTIVVDRNDIGNSTIEIYQLADGAPLESSERSMTFIPKKTPNQIAKPVRPKATTTVKSKSKNRIIKKNSRDMDFSR